MARGIRGFRFKRNQVLKKVNVTYQVDTSISYVEKVKVGDSVLTPSTFTPTKSGYTFIGWRIDSTASSNVISEMVASEDVTLYAVFSNNTAITVSYYQPASTLVTDSGNQIYNNSNILNPSFTLTQTAQAGWTSRGWTTSSTGGDSTIAVADGGSVTLSANATYYGCYQKTVTVSYDGNGSTSGSTASSTGTAYYHSVSGTTNASITLANNGFTKTNYTYYQWRLNSASGTAYRKGTTYSSSDDATMYAEWLTNVTTFNYTGGTQSFASKSGVTYTLQLYGAQGGDGYDISGGAFYAGANGGYTTGQRTGDNTTWYVVVGQKPTTSSTYVSTMTGGYNGGGDAKSTSSATTGIAGGGGGATHIGITNTLLVDTTIANLIAVAGGGGGTSKSYVGGIGGGNSGGNGTASSFSIYKGLGGTQSEGGKASKNAGTTIDNTQGSFGKGGRAVSTSKTGGYSAGGGGGYYGGGGGAVSIKGDYFASGGGGSGYTGGLTNASMTNGSRTGHGQAIITIYSVDW